MRLFVPLASSVFPTTRLPLGSKATLIGPFNGVPAKTTRASPADGPVNFIPLLVALMPFFGIFDTFLNATIVSFICHRQNTTYRSGVVGEPGGCKSSSRLAMINGEPGRDDPSKRTSIPRSMRTIEPVPALLS